MGDKTEVELVTKRDRFKLTVDIPQIGFPKETILQVKYIEERHHGIFILFSFELSDTEVLLDSYDEEVANELHAFEFEGLLEMEHLYKVTNDSELYSWK